MKSTASQYNLQDFEYQPEDFTRMLDIQPPVAMSVMNNDVGDALAALVTAAMQPYVVVSN